METIYALTRPEIVEIINHLHQSHLYLMQEYETTGDYNNVIEANDLFNDIIHLRELVNYWPTTDDK